MMRVMSLALLLAACARPEAPAPTPGPAPGPAAGVRCDANAAQALVGQPADAVIAQAQRLSGARVVRRYRTGDPLTMDLRPDRLDVETDAAGVVVKLGCG